MPVYQPQYVNKFVCDGNACQDNCCKNNWDIYLDKASFDKLRIKAGKTLVASFFSLAKKNNDQYAKLIKKENRCTALNSENLCEIQSNFGEEFLPKACHYFPREISHIGNDVLFAMSMSCPIALRLCINNESSVIECFHENNFDKTIYTKFYKATSDVTKNSYLNSFNLINDTLQSILSVERNIESKLFYLAFVFSKSRSFFNEKNTDLPEFLAIFEKYIKKDVYETIFSEFEQSSNDSNMPIQILLGTMSNIPAFPNEKFTNLFLALVSKYAGASSSSGMQLDITKLEENYKQLLAGLNKAQLSQIDIALTRLVINNLIADPYLMYRDLYEYISWYAFISMLAKFLIVLKYSSEEEPLEDTIITIIYSLARALKSHPKFEVKLKNLVINGVAEDLQNIMLLLKI